MKEEYESIIKNNTWDLVKLPNDKQPIGCRWLFKLKFKVGGSIDKHKVRLVEKGIPRFSPVAKLNTIRLIIALATKNHWKIHQLDVKSTLLNGDLKEEVYLVQPEGFVKKGEEHFVFRLKKTLYGLKQATRSWYEKIDSIFLMHGYKRSKNDPKLYNVFNYEGQIALISLYIHDLIMIGSVDNLIEEIKQQLSQKFEMKDLGEMHYYLGLEVCRDSSQTFLSQGYIDSDWEKKLDNRRSIAGYAFNIGSEVISWCNKKKHTVALSSAKAEYQAMCTTACEVVWLYRLLQDAGEEKT
eukprot:PITA_31021